MKANVFKISITIIFFVTFVVKAQWMVNPGSSKCFVENKGQFSNEAITNEIIEFGVRNSGYQIYFTKNSFVVRYDLVERHAGDVEGNDDEKEEATFVTKTTQLEYKWQDVSNNVKVETEEVVSNLFHYASNNKSAASIYGCKA